jgi:UDP-N-acetylmuramate dehydrogenase
MPPKTLQEIAYYRTGGTFDRLCAPTSVEMLAATAAALRRDRTPYFLLGAGSNSLIMDDHWPGAVLVFERLRTLRVEGHNIIAGAGVTNSELAEAAHKASLAGAAWLYGLPGQLGATTRMNARCYDGEIGQVVDSVAAVSTGGQIKTYPNSAVFRGYKDTIFIENGEMVAEVSIRLQPGDPVGIAEQMRFCRDDRERKRQFLHPSCGCVFRNDYRVGVPSGLLLDKAGVRRYSNGRVEISPWHANFVFNRGASAREILLVTMAMRERVYHEFGVWLAYEMEILGRLPTDLAARVNEIREPKHQEEKLAVLRASMAPTAREP